MLKAAGSRTLNAAASCLLRCKSPCPTPIIIHAPLPSPHHAGGLKGKSLLDKDSSGPWYQQVASLPALLQNQGGGTQPSSSSSSQVAPPTTLDDAQVDVLRQRCEELLANEAAAFDRDLKRRNAADYKWIMRVKRSGTTSDKVAAITLQVQVGELHGATGNGQAGVVNKAGGRCGVGKLSV